jgi:hypothetical protein
MVDQITLQTIGMLLTGISLTIAATYYTLTLRNAEKTRKTQLFMQLYNHVTSKEFVQNFGDTLNMEWEDYEDFERKWGSGNNTEAYAKRYTVWYAYDGIGYLLKHNLIDIDIAYHLNGTAALYQWSKYESIIKYQREVFNIPELALWFEYLVQEIRKRRIKLGHSEQVPESYGRLFTNDYNR